jgi:cytochrome P450
MCIGTQFAIMVAQLTLASIVWRLRLRMVLGTGVEPQALITLRPRGTVDVMLEQA